MAESAVHLVDRSSVCALVCSGSRPRPHPTTRTATRPAVVRTSVHAHWLPFQNAPSRPPAPGRTFPRPHDVLVASLGTLRSRYPPKQSAATRRATLLLQ